MIPFVNLDHYRSLQNNRQPFATQTALNGEAFSTLVENPFYGYFRVGVLRNTGPTCRVLDIPWTITHGPFSSLIDVRQFARSTWETRSVRARAAHTPENRGRKNANTIAKKKTPCMTWGRNVFLETRFRREPSWTAGGCWIGGYDERHFSALFLRPFPAAHRAISNSRALCRKPPPKTWRSSLIPLATLLRYDVIWLPRGCTVKRIRNTDI